MLAVASLVFTSCEGDETIEEILVSPLIVTTADDGSIIYTGTITENTTWTAEQEYVLSGRVIVAEGATLTIEEGAVIKGESGSGNSASVLIVARGGKLNANGTAANPVVFTSTQDNLTVDGYAEVLDDNVVEVAAGTPALSSSDNSLWGGVIVLGKAPVSVASGSEAQIEGIPATVTAGLYGGSESDDNSGSITYISIRHGGIEIGAGNEINGLTLGGVGSETVIENVEVYANFDDGIEFFGGTVDVTNAVVWAAGDDAIDTDQGWAGTLDNFVVVAAGNSAFELDGPEGDDDATAAKHTITNGTVTGFGDHAIDMDDDSNVDLNNIAFEIAGDAYTADNASESLDAANSAVTDIYSEDPSGVTAAELFPGITLSTDATIGADTSSLTWTFASSQSAF